MIVSTKGRYAVRVMIDMAEHNSGEYIPLREIAQRHDISRKYLETIMTTLSKAELVESTMGKEGGYRLVKDPADYKIGDILRVTEKNLAPVACLCDDLKKCEKTEGCYTLPFWKGLEDQINSYIDGHTLKDLLEMKDENKKAETCA